MVTTVKMAMGSLVKGDLTEWTEKDHHPTSAPVLAQPHLLSRKKETNQELQVPSPVPQMTCHQDLSLQLHPEVLLYQALTLDTQVLEHAPQVVNNHHLDFRQEVPQVLMEDRLLVTPLVL